MRIHRDGSGLIASWLVRLVLGFVVVAVVLFDGGSILVNFFTLDSTADDIANEISLDVPDTPRFQFRQLELKAEELADEAGARLLDFSVDEEGDVHVELRRRANTLVVGRIDAIKDWARATAEGEAGSTPGEL